MVTHISSGNLSQVQCTAPPRLRYSSAIAQVRILWPRPCLVSTLRYRSGIFICSINKQEVSTSRSGGCHKHYLVNTQDIFVSNLPHSGKCFLFSAHEVGGDNIYTYGLACYFGTSNKI